MIPNETFDRADATVWLPLLQILGGVAERVARRQSDKTSISDDPAAGSPAARTEEGR
jgi:hypothetical protein